MTLKEDARREKASVSDKMVDTRMTAMDTVVSRVMGRGERELICPGEEGQYHLSCLLRRVALEVVTTSACKIHPGSSWSVHGGKARLFSIRNREVSLSK